MFGKNRLPHAGAGIAVAVSTAAFPLLAPDGVVGAPSYSFAGAPNMGLFRNANVLSLVANGVIFAYADLGNASNLGVNALGFATAASGSCDTLLTRAAQNSVQFAGTTTVASATGRTELNKAVSAIADAVATAVLTVTIPNGAHSASLLVRPTGSLGAGGAIGANEASAENTYLITITRVAGVAAVAAISAAFGAAAANVAGAATVTCVAALSAMSGAVGATNTFTVNVTITRSAGTSTNHTCLLYAQLMNANASGITIA